MPYVYPTSAELFEIEQDLIRSEREGRVGLDIMPDANSNAAKVRWTQQDNYYGLQAMRGLDGAPTRVTRVGRKTYEYEPGVFGEFEDITETELTTRAGSLDVDAAPIDVADLVLAAQKELIGREYDRKESSIWSVLLTGILTIQIDGPTGTQVYKDSYSIQTFTAATPWATLGSATPIANFQAVQQLGQAAGHSVDFGAGAVAYMNNATANLLLNNTNASDFGGRRNQSGATINNLTNVASYWQAQNLPRIVTYDGGFIPKIGGAFTKFIPNNKVIVVGKRPRGARVGEYLMTKNLSNGGRPGPYQYVIDRVNGYKGEKRTPANIEIHRGHNGGPAIYFPSAVLVMSV